ncbi:hypothetical protein KDK77_07590 [bacterium]|nr:hypothetical protein [bacterium]
MKDDTHQLTFTYSVEEGLNEELVRKNTVYYDNAPQKKNAPVYDQALLTADEFMKISYTIVKSGNRHQVTCIEHPTGSPPAMQSAIERAIERISAPLP